MRIVSLLPSATEILFALGLGEQVVGVTHECDFPEQAATVPALTSSALAPASSSNEIDRHVRASLHSGSSLYHLNSGLLERLEPDMIITQELCAVCAVSYDIVDRAAKRLRSDPRIVSLEPSSLDDVFANILTIAHLAGVAATGERLVSSLRERVENIREKTSTLRRPRALVLEWTDPPMSGGHWTPGLVEIAGGIPVLANPGANSRVISWSAISREDPDVLIVAPCGFGLDRTKQAIREMESLPAFAELRAVQSGHVFAVDGNAFVNRPGPRLVETAQIFMSCLHPSLEGQAENSIKGVLYARQ